jgi:uncharacterized membrane protein YedE/YeeE
MTAADVWNSLAGGLLIGMGLSGMLVGMGRISGASGVLASVIDRKPEGMSWRLMFIAGLITAGVIAWIVDASSFDAAAPRALPLVVLAGLLVGTGTRMGNGCTSGHGVCGMSRMSRRSIVATCVFMVTGVATAVGSAQLGFGSP